MGDDWDDLDDEFSAEALAQEQARSIVMGRELGRRIAAGRRHVLQVSKKVARNHDLDAHLEVHTQLCSDVVVASTESPAVVLGEKLPRGIPRPAATRERLEHAVELMDRLRSDARELASVLAEAGFENPVGTAALWAAGFGDPAQSQRNLASFDFTWELPDLIHNRMRTARSLVLAATEHLPAEAPGKPANPEWHTHAARLCLGWWERNLGSKPEIQFGLATTKRAGKRSRAWSPESDFTHWFCDLMRELTGLNTAACRTALTKISPPKQTPRTSQARSGRRSGSVRH